jgi:hypothetical protein
MIFKTYYIWTNRVKIIYISFCVVSEASVFHVYSYVKFEFKTSICLSRPIHDHNVII